jgi:hypothetical protein
MELFYRVRDATITVRGYPWGWKIIPSAFDRSMVCNTCGHPIMKPPGYPRHTLSVLLEGGTKWPDVLGTTELTLVVSEAVLSDWQRHRVTGYESFPLTIAECKSKKLAELATPNYYHIRAIGRAKRDLNQMGITIRSVCIACGYQDFWPPAGFPYHIVPDSWDGTDIFASDDAPMMCMCTSKILTLAGMYNHTNFSFVPEGAYPASKSSLIDYRLFAKEHPL